MPSTAQQTQGHTYLDKEAIRQVLTMQNVIMHYGIDVLKGEQVRCPFHGEDKKASATIRNNYFYCFTCQKSLDALGFIQDMENCDFKTALEIAAALVGIRPTTSQADLAYALNRRKHDKAELDRVSRASDFKYDILCRIARIYRPQNPAWLLKLDHLLDAWIKVVPLWVNLFSIVWACDNKPELERALDRLCQENEYREVTHA